MYGKHRVILRTDPKQTVVVAGKQHPQGGSYHPMGFWEKRECGFYAHLRAPTQWYSAVKREELGMHFSAPTQKQLRDIILDYYRQTENER